MGETNIEWAHYTVNAWTGCTKVSPACKHCYAEHDTPIRIVEHAMGVQFGAESQDGKIRLPMWGGHDKRTGEGYRVETVGWEKQLRALNRKAARLRENARDATIVVGGQEGCPIEVLRGLPYKRPRVFINSLSDTFEAFEAFEAFEGPVYRKQNGRFEVVANSLDDVRKRLFAIIEECTELDILLLTKRPENVLCTVPVGWRDPLSIGAVLAHFGGKAPGWPSHVWLGTTAENQEMANKRIPELLRIPARVRFLSMEPLLGEVDLAKAYEVSRANGGTFAYPLEVNEGGYSKIDWVIVGGESGKNARPMHPRWARKVRDQCVAAGVPFFFKQWGEWAPNPGIAHKLEDVALWNPKDDNRWIYLRDLEPDRRENWDEHHSGDVRMYRIGKKNAGRLLDGREWNEVPK